MRREPTLSKPAGLDADRGLRATFRHPRTSRAGLGGLEPGAAGRANFVGGGFFHLHGEAAQQHGSVQRWAVLGRGQPLPALVRSANLDTVCHPYLAVRAAGFEPVTRSQHG